MRSLEKSVLDTIRDARMMVAGDRVGVAVSGGADSVALLRLLESIRAELGITLLVVHFDHALRGAESDLDAQFAGELSKKVGLEFVYERADVAAAAAENKWNLEDAARRLRYAFFEGVVSEGRATKIAVAHTADDQAETVLAHILRGTGPSGLGGIYPSAGSVIRPLLGLKREDLREYLRAIGQDWREDSTNLDTRRMRARIRGQLLPVLERDFSPQAVKHLSDLAELAREEKRFWDALVHEKFEKLVSRRGDASSIAMADLLSPLALDAAGKREAVKQAGYSQPLRALTERLIRRLYQETRGGLQGLTVEHVRQVVRLATESSSGHRVELPGGVVAERVFGDLVFFKTLAVSTSATRTTETESEAGAYQHVVILPERGETTVSVPELKRRFCLKVIDWSLAERETTIDTAALDADRLGPPLVLRNWRQGDSYRARGHKQVQKLKRMFLERHIPRHDRFAWPVLESAGRVAWVLGMPPADDFCAGENTRVGVVIEEERL